MKNRKLRAALALAMVMLACSSFPVAAESGHFDEFLKIESDEQKESYVQNLSDKALLELANEAGFQDPSGQYVEWIIYYGLKPRWDRAPLAPETHLSMICDDNLSAAWRTALMTRISKHCQNWTVEEIERAINEGLRVLRGGDWPSALRARISGTLGQVIHAKMRSIPGDGHLTVAKKKELADHLHLTARAVISCLLERLSQEQDADEVLLRSYVSTLHNLGAQYLVVPESYPPEYNREGEAFAEAATAAQAIPPVLKKIIVSQEYPPWAVIEAERTLHAMKLDADIPDNLAEIQKGNPKFSPEQLERLARDLKKPDSTE